MLLKPLLRRTPCVGDVVVHLLAVVGRIVDMGFPMKLFVILLVVLTLLLNSSLFLLLVLLLLLLSLDVYPPPSSPFVAIVSIGV